MEIKKGVRIFPQIINNNNLTLTYRDGLAIRNTYRMAVLSSFYGEVILKVNMIQLAKLRIKQINTTNNGYR